MICTSTMTTYSGTSHAQSPVDFSEPIEAGQLAVVGALIRQASENFALSEIWRHLPTQQSGERALEGTVINVADLPPLEHEYYHYTGSLTPPPHREGVTRFVMKEPISAAADQIRQFTSIFAMNARPARPVNGRLVPGERLAKENRYPAIG